MKELKALEILRHKEENLRYGVESGFSIYANELIEVQEAIAELESLPVLMGIKNISDAPTHPRFKNLEYETIDKHPLVNEDSPHYKMLGGVQSIHLMEEIFTTEELMAWAKITAFKYRMRIGKKDDPTIEVKKIKTFEAYYEYLEKKL